MILKFIKKYINYLTIDDIKSFCEKENISYLDSELPFALNYIKNNYKTILNNPDFTLQDIKPHLSNNTYEQVKCIYLNYLKKYKDYL